MAQLSVMTKSRYLMIIPLAILGMALLMVFSPATALAQDPDGIAETLKVIADEIEHIAEDMEEIHHDMHKIVFSLRLISYASIGVFVVLLIHLIVSVLQKRR